MLILEQQYFLITELTHNMYLHPWENGDKQLSKKNLTTMIISVFAKMEMKAFLQLIMSFKTTAQTVKRKWKGI